MSFFSAFSSQPKANPVVNRSPSTSQTHTSRDEDTPHHVDPQNPLQDSILIEKEKWTPYKNALIFASSVLLWQRPVVLGVISVLTHIILWFGTRLVMRAHYSILLGVTLWLLFVTDYVMKVSGNSWTQLLQKFPGPGHAEPNRDYDEIIHQYVTARRLLKSFIQIAKQQRKENLHQFTISALFFSMIFCAFLYFIKTFLLIYVVVFSFLLGPGLIKHNVPSRIWEFLLPHMMEGYAMLNTQLQQFLHPETKPADGSVSQPQTQPNPSAVRMPPGSLPPRNQYGSENLHRMPSSRDYPLRPSQMGQNSHNNSSLYRNVSVGTLRPEVENIPSTTRFDGTNRSQYETNISQRNSTHNSPW